MQEKAKLTKPKATYGFLLQAIKANRKDLAEDILYLDKNYFQDQGSEGIRKENCYLREAISRNNIELLKLLLNYGWPALIYKDIGDGNEDEHKLSNLFGNGKRRILIDPKEPFITHDYEMLSILIDYMDDPDKPCELSWKEKDGRQYTVYMTLLASALYFNQMSIVELLMKKGSTLHFRLFGALAEVTRDTFGIGYGPVGPVNNPLITGYCIRGAFNPEHLLMDYKWSPISIVFRKGNDKLIHWLMRNRKGLPQETEEIRHAALQLKGESYEEFAKSYPEIVRKISLEEILSTANYRALRIHFKNSEYLSNNELIFNFLSFKKQLSRSWEDIFDYLMTEDYLQCVKELLQLLPDLFRTDKVQIGLFGLFLFFLYMGNVSSKTWSDIFQYPVYNSIICPTNGSYPMKYRPVGYSSDVADVGDTGYKELFSRKAGLCRKMTEALLRYCPFILSKVQDATEFMEWYYEQWFRESLKEMKKMIKLLFKDKPLLDISIFDFYFSAPDLEQDNIVYDKKKVTMKQLSDIMDTFAPYDSKSSNGMISFHGFHKVIVQKNNPELVKSMAVNGYISEANLEPMVEYAVDIKSDNILPYLINIKWRESKYADRGYQAGNHKS